MTHSRKRDHHSLRMSMSECSGSQRVACSLGGCAALTGPALQLVAFAEWVKVELGSTGPHTHSCCANATAAPDIILTDSDG